PTHVVVRVVGEVVVARFLGAGVGLGGQEPLVPVAGVVGRQVAHHPHAACVGHTGQRYQGRAPAEQWIHRIEGGCDGAVCGPGREERCQVHDLGAQVGQVVQVAPYPVQGPAVVLGGRVRARSQGLVVPVPGNGPVGVLGRGLERVVVAGETVREDLVDGGTRHPRGWVGSGDQSKVAVVGDLVVVRACLRSEERRVGRGWRAWYGGS